MIICAAIKIEHTNIAGDEELEPIIICGHRHGNCFEIAKRLYCNISKYTEGFINHKGEFLDRKEAFEHFKECGQCNATQRWYWEDHNQDELYSEDLY